MKFYNIKKVVGNSNPITTRLNSLTKNEAFMYCYNSKRMDPLCKLYVTVEDIVKGTQTPFNFIYNQDHKECRFVKVKITDQQPDYAPNHERG